MDTQNSSSPISIIAVLVGLVILAVGAYVVTHPDTVKAPGSGVATTTEPVATSTATTGTSTQPTAPATGVSAATKASIAWKLTAVGTDGDSKTRTQVAVSVSGKSHIVGVYNGSCIQLNKAGTIGTGGVDGSGLLINSGEVSAVQCWYAGAGTEVGIFEQGGKLVVKIGRLAEGTGGSAGFRGDFNLKTDITL